MRTTHARRHARFVIAAGLVLALLVGCEGEFPAGGAQLRAAAAAYDADRLARSLRDIEAWHVAHRTGLAASLRPGLPMPSIDAAFAGEACRPTDELKALWAWRNGGRTAVPFVWYHDFLSMEEAKAEYRWLLLNPLVPWDPRYLPVFTFEGEWYASYCGPAGTLSGPLVLVSLEDEPRIAYANLTAYLATMAEALGSGAVSWENGAMVEDIGKVLRIYRKRNRGYEFPYHVPKGS
jgi:hypothetical protein